MDYKQLYTLARESAKDKGITLRKIAAHIDVETKTILNWGRPDAKPNFIKFTKMLRFVGIEVKYTIDGVEI